MFLYMGSGDALMAYSRARRVQMLNECAGACAAVVRRGLEQLGGAQDDSSTTTCSAMAVSSARDCLELCALAASLLVRESELARRALPACVEACRRCAESCEALSPDELALECSRLCRECGNLCGS